MYIKKFSACVHVYYISSAFVIKCLELILLAYPAILISINM